MTATRWFQFQIREQGSSSAGSKHREPRIRCPLCKWVPRKHDRWSCACGHVWNTFDTRGVCPGCSHAWRDTQCLGCHRWSKHDDWYVDDPAE
jgi:hypothetical protein